VVILSLVDPIPSDPFVGVAAEASEDADEEEPSEELSGDLTGGGTSSFFFGRKAALMSPIPTKNSSAYEMSRHQHSRDSRESEENLQGMTLTRFGDPSHTSARSSMMTTMFVSQGNSLCKLFLVIPRPDDMGSGRRSS